MMIIGPQMTSKLLMISLFVLQTSRFRREFFFAVVCLGSKIVFFAIKHRLWPPSVVDHKMHAKLFAICEHAKRKRNDFQMLNQIWISCWQWIVHEEGKKKTCRSKNSLSFANCIKHTWQSIAAALQMLDSKMLFHDIFRSAEWSPRQYWMTVGVVCANESKQENPIQLHAIKIN